MSRNTDCIAEWFADLPQKRPFSFRAATTIGAGGTASAALYPRSEAEFAETVARLEAQGIPFCVLGCGSNVLASDKGFGGAVIKTDRMETLRLLPQGIEAACGVRIARLLSFAAANHCGGLEFLAGIPASTGGAVFMNAGACGKFAAERVLSVRALYRGSVMEMAAEECAFSYKHSLFMDEPIYVLSAVFQTVCGDKQSILREIKRVLVRRSRLPRGKSMGCVFKNPSGCSAGELIEQAGLKGAFIGDAVVAREHANFILNRGGATASEIRSLIEHVRARVFENSGVTLEEEIRYIGEF